MVCRSFLTFVGRFAVLHVSPGGKAVILLLILHDAHHIKLCCFSGFRSAGVPAAISKTVNGANEIFCNTNTGIEKAFLHFLTNYLVHFCFCASWRNSVQ